MAKRDPICGMEGRWAAHNEVFCSIRCLREYETKNNLPQTEPVKIKTFSLARLLHIFVFSSIVGLILTGQRFAGLVPIRESLIEYLFLVGPAFSLGIAIASVIDVLVPKEIISSFIGRGGVGDVFKGSALGFLASSCSHGCLALSVELYKKGASPAAFLSFLMASPWASLPTTILLVRLFGTKGLLVVGLAFIVSLITGTAMVGLYKKGWIAKNPNHIPYADKPAKKLLLENFSQNKNPAAFLKNLKEAAAGLLGMTLPWVALGILLSAVIGTSLGHLLHQYLGKGAWGPVASLAAATIVEVCSEGSSPIAFEIYKQTGALGSAFIFLEAGVITDITEISLVAANAGKKVALAMVALALPQALLIGYLLNAAF
ncbi:MAG: permease [Elusimicrobia bacterium]|nr:permease [Elusimicrobiota bacterium]